MATLVLDRSSGAFTLQFPNEAEQAAAARATWLAQLRTALETAESAAQTLLGDPASAAEANNLLTRLAAIRAEVDALQRGRAPRTPARITQSQACPPSRFL